MSLVPPTGWDAWIEKTVCCKPVFTLPHGNSTNLKDDPDLSPLIYHVPGTLNSLYILPQDYALPPDEFEFAIWRTRAYVADKIASAKGETNVPLPPDQDPKIYGDDSPVRITWQSFHGMKLTWGMLAAAMRGLDDCLVKNNHLPYVAMWHVFDARMESEMGWGTIGKGKGIRRPGAVA
ncbi:MAG: hypothetical protein Q9170_003581 [Blastenia crenularia]